MLELLLFRLGIGIIFSAQLIFQPCHQIIRQSADFVRRDRSFVSFNKRAMVARSSSTLPVFSITTSSLGIARYS